VTPGFGGRCSIQLSYTRTRIPSGAPQQGDSSLWANVEICNLTTVVLNQESCIVSLVQGYGDGEASDE
jgi:hypothetical protein